MGSNRARLALAACSFLICSMPQRGEGRGLRIQPEIGAKEKPVIVADGYSFHDLNGDGRLEPYEDWRLSPERRAADLLARMTVKEKIGLLLHGSPPTGDHTLAGAWDIRALGDMVEQSEIRFFINRLSGKPSVMAATANAIQLLAERSRLGIPAVFSSDPRNQQRATLGLTSDAGSFSLWPEPPGFGAIGDPKLVARFAAVSALEYRAVGIRMALSPMADLATEPRWPRVSGTFGDKPTAVAKLVAAYIAGMQGGRTGVTPAGVGAVVKHWVGYGAEPGGWDAHNFYGRTLSLTSASLRDHLIPFQAAFAVGAAGVMPTYGILPANVSIKGKPSEAVGAGFNKALITGLLRKTYGYGGIVLTDWGIVNDCDKKCEEGSLSPDKIGMPWGVQALDKADRFAKALDAGVDQFGGASDAALIETLVNSRRIPATRIDDSARRILIFMFQLGIFENPYVDPVAADRIVGNASAMMEGKRAQKRAVTLLKNAGGVLPLDLRGKKVWTYNMAPGAADGLGFTIVSRPEDADLSILRVVTPFTQHQNYFFGARHHEGVPEFLPSNPDRQAVERAVRAGKPVIVSVYLDRPAILAPLARITTGLVGEYGISDRALLEVLSGSGSPQGRLPFELPRSKEAVEAQRPDLGSDSRQPLFPRGFGLRYAVKTQRTR